MGTHISKSTLILLCILAFVLGIGSYMGVRLVNASADSAEQTQEDDSKKQDDKDNDSERTIVLERDAQAQQTTQAPAPAPAPTPAPISSDYVLPESATRKYSYAELASLDNYQLYLARNEIYARHGRTFRRADLNNYFGQKSWYTPLYSPDEFDALNARVKQLNGYEEYNMSSMLAIEKSRNSPYI